MTSPSTKNALRERAANWLDHWSKELDPLIRQRKIDWHFPSDNFVPLTEKQWSDW